ncbi:MAG: hypothetical protein ACLSHC_18685 [Bilophila wadsworthia]
MTASIFPAFGLPGWALGAVLRESVRHPAAGSRLLMARGLWLLPDATSSSRPWMIPK